MRIKDCLILANKTWWTFSCCWVTSSEVITHYLVHLWRAIKQATVLQWCRRFVSYSVFIDKRAFLKSPLGSSSNTIIICRREGRREGGREGGGREGGREGGGREGEREGGREGREREGEREGGREKVMSILHLCRTPLRSPFLILKLPLEITIMTSS